MMNITGIELKEGETLTVKIEKNTPLVNKTANTTELVNRILNKLKLEKRIENLKFDLETMPLYDEIEMIEFPSYDYDYSYGYSYGKRSYSYVKRMQDESNIRINSWRITDPKRYADYQAYIRMPSQEMWDTTRFKIGDRVQIHYFLDQEPGYSYLKGKIGTIISINTGVLQYVIVQFDNMDVKQQLIPGVLTKIKNYKLPPVMNPELIRTKRLREGWEAHVEGYDLTWEYGDSKNEAIHRLLITWYWNIRNQ